MNNAYTGRNRLISLIYEIYYLLVPLFKSKYLYISLISVIAGSQMNYASQTYLHNYMSEGKTLPMLSDMILDNLPVIDVALLYDLFSIFSSVIIGIYIIHKKEYNRIPYIFLLCGIFLIVRGIFIILTPFGNPPQFNGSDHLFNGFSKYELGVYPSGHVGNAFLFLLLVNDRLYKWLVGICLIVIIVTLFLAHSHYSIDILSGLFFAYAIFAFGEKYLTMFNLDIKRD